MFEKSARIGGLLRYGIPDFKLDKGVIDRRLDQLRAEGVKFRAGVYVGTKPPPPGVGSDARETVDPQALLAQFDAVVLAGGAEEPRDLPVPGRNFFNLVAVAPGITGHGAVGGGAPADAPDNFGTEKTVDASGNGRNYSGNQFTLDGLNITSNILQGTANLTPNADSIREMTVQTNLFNVEHGRGSSVQIEMTTKSGTNQYHGTGAYFFTNQGLWARSRFQSAPYAPFKKNDIAGTLGGPIIKNHTFAFASVELLRGQISQAASPRNGLVDGPPVDARLAATAAAATVAAAASPCAIGSPRTRGCSGSRRRNHSG